MSATLHGGTWWYMVVHACLIDLIVSQNILEFDKAAVKRFHLLGSQEKLGNMYENVMSLCDPHVPRHARGPRPQGLVF